MEKSQEETLRATFNRAIQEFSPHYVSSSLVENVVADLISCIDNNSTPYDIFNCFSSGAFKEAYDEIPGLVFKLASYGNQTKREIALLQEAQKAGLGDIFLPTYFIKLEDTYLHMPLVEENNQDSVWDSERETYVDYREDIYAEYIELQPMATPFNDSEKEFKDFDWRKISHTKDYTVIHGTPISNELLINCSSKNEIWVGDFVEYYGPEKFERFVNFCGKHHVSDLHDDNIGYYEGRPIILDWLSAQRFAQKNKSEGIYARAREKN